MNADEYKRKSRGWSEEMDSASVARRLAIVDDLYECWKSLKKAQKVSLPSSETAALNQQSLTSNE